MTTARTAERFYLDARPCALVGNAWEHHFPRERGDCQCGTYASTGGNPLAPQVPSPRVLARITEEDTQTYRWRCESCVNVDERSEYLHNAAAWAHDHAITTGHAVLVEAL